MRVAVYVRVSTQRQAQTQTIEQQLERLRTYIQEQNWTLPDEQIFRDDGYSGSRLNRPGLDRLRDKVRMAELDRVLLTAPDRLARNFVHQMLLLEEMERFGCQVVFLDRPMTNDPHDQLLLQIRGAVAEYERTLIAERMRRGRQMKLRAGTLLPWTRAPYALRLDPDHPRDPAGMRVDPVEAAQVAEMFAWYLTEGATLYGLAQHLQQQGVPTPRERMFWNAASVRGILTNPVYTGQVVSGRTRSQPARTRRSALKRVGRSGESCTRAPQEEWSVVTRFSPIVSQEQFDLVQAKLARNRLFARRNMTAEEAYLLRGLVSCGVCQLACTGRRSHPGYIYYACRGKDTAAQSGRLERCPARYAPAPALDALVWDDLCVVLSHPEMIACALERVQGGHWLPQEFQARRENLRRGHTSLERQIERLTEAYLSGVIPLAELQRRRQELEERLQVLARQIEQLEAQGDRQSELSSRLVSIRNFCDRVATGLAKATFAQKRALVELLIDRVVVTNGDVEIRYVIPTTPNSEKSRFCHLRKDYFDLEAQSVIVNQSLCRQKQVRAQENDMSHLCACEMGLDDDHDVDAMGKLLVQTAHLIHLDKIPIFRGL
jgi:site-specific DNA recombinase